MNKSTRTVELGVVFWRLPDGKPHRVDGPAIEWPDGYKAWYINGELHRTDGPAIEHINGNKEWWVNGQKLNLKTYIRSPDGLPELVHAMILHDVMD